MHKGFIFLQNDCSSNLAFVLLTAVFFIDYHCVGGILISYCPFFFIISEIESELLQMPSVPEFDPSDVSDTQEYDMDPDDDSVPGSAHTDESVPYNSQLPDSFQTTDESIPDSQRTDESLPDRGEIKEMSQET